ncbi:hypothetical protein ABZ719_26490 [Streptomyces sp. NPDC006743]|uniref:hypothetical protein n=1 Tax=Streptomyces sp. NPDC006743 TaxID=3154480 RepID=UPI0034515005
MQSSTDSGNGADFRNSAHRAARPGSGSTAVEGVAAGAGLPFDRRVLVLAEIADDPNETALAEELFTGRGWPVRPAAEHERAGCPPDRVARLVEVRLAGARDGAVERALSAIDHLAVAASLRMWARDAVLLEHEPEQYTAWRVRAAPGTPRVHRVIRTAEPRGRTEALADLRARALAGAALGADADVEVLETSLDVKANLILVNTGNAVALAAAVLALTAHGAWQFTGGFVTVVFGLAFLASGVRHALRDLPTRRAAAWAVPLAAPLLLPLVAWLGTLVHERYVRAFGIPPDSVHTGTTERLLAGALPLLGVLYCTVFGVAAYGWNRWAHADTTGTEAANAAFGAGLGLCLGVVTVLLPFVTDAYTQDAAHAQVAAAHGRQPAAFHGLHPAVVCVHPLTRVAHPERGLPGAAYGGTVPLTHPVLTFGPDGDRTWLWDPATRRALDMDLGAASIAPSDPYSPGATCG